MVLQLSKEEYIKTKWWRETEKWIKQIPQEFDNKKYTPPLKRWKVFEKNTLDAARYAAWDAAWDAALDATRDVALDAALLAQIKICAGLKLDKKHVRHAEERWEANKRGYRVCCDINGVLYVYRKKIE
jgi:hypothetical protein